MTNIEPYLNRILHGDCIQAMGELPPASVGLIVTDPPYIVNYRSRDGRRCANDDNDRWLRPAVAQMYRVLTPDSYCVSFYGWHQADRFLTAWREVGFRPVGHLVWVKRYASKQGFTRAHHECAYLLAKGRPQQPVAAPRDVLSWEYTGNRLHPTQKPVAGITPLIRAYSQPGDIVLDPFAGSGTTAVAARQSGRSYIGIELVAEYHRQAMARLNSGKG